MEGGRVNRGLSGYTLPDTLLECAPNYLLFANLTFDVVDTLKSGFNKKVSVSEML